ncbi:MAG: hypothetical protein HY696_07475 [Deltaproteobacteria bacterium]|nr:hypothetical protein [Deltaproteobacteria bacterium]
MLVNLTGKVCRTLPLVILLGAMACGPLSPLRFLHSSASETETTPDELLPSTEPRIEAAERYALALGGVAPGRDELLLAERPELANTTTATDFRLFSSNPKVVGLLPRPGFADFLQGRGAWLIPQRPGAVTIRIQLDGTERDPSIAVTVPPQAVIQILVAEAQNLLLHGAHQTAGHVERDSRSPTGSALAAVIRNRVGLIGSSGDPGLFVADAELLYADPPASAYEAVITAHTATSYQFSPVDPDDPNHELYEHAEARGFLSEEFQLAYDQAVLTAAAMYDGSADDPTHGAFAFRSPTDEEWACLNILLVAHGDTLPAACGPGDEDFPTLAPVQLVVMPDVPRYDDGRPTFIFYRMRADNDPVITEIP